MLYLAACTAAAFPVASSDVVAWYDTASGNVDVANWCNRVNTANKAVFSGNGANAIEKLTDPANSGYGNECPVVNYLEGTAVTTIQFPESYTSYATGMTVCVVARHITTAGGFRIFSGPVGDYVFGHYGQTSGTMRFGSGCTVSSMTLDSLGFDDTDWVAMCGAFSGTVSSAFGRAVANGLDFSISTNVSGCAPPATITVNIQGAGGGSDSDFAVAALVTWNRALDLTEMFAAQAALSTTFCIPNVTNLAV